LKLKVKVLHPSQLFAQLVQEGKLRFKNWNITCVYQDACQMGRWAKVYEEPREALKAIPGVNLVEAEQNRDLALCCGSIPWWCTPAPEGVYVEERHAELADKVARKRFKEFETSTSANMIVTNCTGCQRILSKMADENNPEIKVQMLSEVLASKLIV
jgi:Fe-S oxidoreductase